MKLKNESKFLPPSRNITKLTLISAVIIFSQFANAGDSANIKIVIHGLKNDDGTVRIALANSKENHSLNAKPYQDAETEINDKKATWVFENIPYGDYSIRLFHDENGNKILDKGLFGLPKEPYGYSNNARGRLSAPKWEDAKFKLDVEQVISPIEVK